MYGWLWRHLPGGVLSRLTQCLVLLLGAVAVLFVWLFPWVDAQLPYNDVTVPAPSPTATLPAG